MRKSALWSLVTLFSTFVVVAAAAPIPPPCKCKMYVQIDVFGEQVYWCDTTCLGGAQCDLHETTSHYGSPAYQCRCGGIQDPNCACQVNHWYWDSDDGVFKVNCQNRSCASACRENWDPDVLVVGGIYEACECP